MAESQLVKDAARFKRALAAQISAGKKKGDPSYDAALKKAVDAEKKAKAARQRSVTGKRLGKPGLKGS